MRKTLWLNVIAGIIDIIMFLFGIGKIIITYKNINMKFQVLYYNLSIIQIVAMVLAMISLIMHIIAFVEANNNGVYNVGNVLGIVASGIIILKLGVFKVFSIVVYFIAALFSMIQKESYL
ncbi:hypothetical protein [Clostridium massiliamazoniense]|uniref:hypothetical protein n=1 Tax=Clostridium massiliamazoniense TaxID=1347366 RepID=UPI0006D77141|nr:hypothetical protein [Clostridium massiliamazoniense]